MEASNIWNGIEVNTLGEVNAIFSDFTIEQPKTAQDLTLEELMSISYERGYAQTNEDDSYEVRASSSRISDFKAIPGYKRDKVKSRVSYGGRFPKTTHFYTIKFYAPHHVGYADALTAKLKALGVPASTSYNAIG